MTATRYAYVLVRADLPHPIQCVQAVHAAIAASRSYPLPESAEHPHLVILAVKDEEALRAAHEKLVRRCIGVVPYFEPSMNDEMTAVATPPLQGDARKAFSNYPLLR